MEYDPAFPTGDILKKRKKKKKLLAIPLPELPTTSLAEIPMPNISPDEIEMPPESTQSPLALEPTEEDHASPEMSAHVVSSESQNESLQSQPLKFQMKVTSKLSASTAESLEGSKPKSMGTAHVMRPPLKGGTSHVKRMRAGVLPTGVLGVKKKTEEVAAPAAVFNPAKEPERFVPPTITGTPGMDPSLTLTSEMLDAAKRAINQINSALLGVSSFESSSSQSANTNAMQSQNSASPSRKSSNVPPGTRSTENVSGSRDGHRNRSPVPKRRRTRSPSYDRKSSKKKRRSSSSSESSRKHSRGRHHGRRRSNSGKRRSGQSGSQGHQSKSKSHHRRRSESGRSRSPPQSRRGRSRSLRKALSQSGSDPSSKNSQDPSKISDDNKTSYHRQEIDAATVQTDKSNRRSNVDKVKQGYSKELKEKQNEPRSREYQRGRGGQREERFSKERRDQKSNVREIPKHIRNEGKTDNSKEKRNTRRINEKVGNESRRFRDKKDIFMGDRKHTKSEKTSKYERYEKSTKESHFFNLKESEHHTRGRSFRKQNAETENKYTHLEHSEEIIRRGRESRKEGGFRDTTSKDKSNQHSDKGRRSSTDFHESNEISNEKLPAQSASRMTMRPVHLDHLKEEVDDNSDVDDENYKLEKSTTCVSPPLKSEPTDEGAASPTDMKKDEVLVKQVMDHEYAKCTVEENTIPIKTEKKLKRQISNEKYDKDYSRGTPVSQVENEKHLRNKMDKHESDTHDKDVERCRRNSGAMKENPNKSKSNKEKQYMDQDNSRTGDLQSDVKNMPPNLVKSGKGGIIHDVRNVEEKVWREKRRNSPVEAPESKRRSKVYDEGIHLRSHKDHEVHHNKGDIPKSTDDRKDRKDRNHDHRRDRSRSRSRDNHRQEQPTSPRRSAPTKGRNRHDSGTNQKQPGHRNAHSERLNKDRPRGHLSRSRSREGSRGRARGSNRYVSESDNRPTHGRHDSTKDSSHHILRDREHFRRKEEPSTSQPTYKSLKEEAEERAQRRKEEELRKEKRRGDTTEDSNRRRDRQRSHSHSPSGERTHGHRGRQSGEPSHRQQSQQQEQQHSGRTRRSNGGEKDENEIDQIRVDEQAKDNSNTPFEESKDLCFDTTSAVEAQQSSLTSKEVQESEAVNISNEQSHDNLSPSHNDNVDNTKLQDQYDNEGHLQQKPQSSEFLNILKKFDDFFTALSNMTGNRTHATVAEAAAAASTDKQEVASELPRQRTGSKSPELKSSPQENNETVNRSPKERIRNRRRSNSSTSSSAMSVSGGSSLPRSPDVNELVDPSGARLITPEATSTDPTTIGQMNWHSTQHISNVSNKVDDDYKQSSIQRELLYPSAGEEGRYSTEPYIQDPSYMQLLPASRAHTNNFMGQYDQNVYDVNQYSSQASNQEYQQYYFQQQSQSYQYQQQQHQYESQLQYTQSQSQSQHIPAISHWQTNHSFSQPQIANSLQSDYTSVIPNAQDIGQHGLQSEPQQYPQYLPTSLPNVQDPTTQASLCGPSPLHIATEPQVVKRYDEGWLTSGSTPVSSVPTPLHTPTAQPMSTHLFGKLDRRIARQDSDRHYEDEIDEDEDEEFEEDGSLGADDGQLSGGQGSILEVELGEGDHPSLVADDISSVADKELEMLQKDALNPEMWSERPRTPSLEEQFPDAPKPEYMHIEMSEYRSKSVMRSRSKLETNRWVCDCTVPNPDEVVQGMRPCGDDCINRVLNIECSSRCPISELCTNRQFQEKKYAPVEPYYAGPDKGWGLRARDHIAPGTFVIEYVGEVIDFREFKRRIMAYEKEGHAHHYFMALEADSFIDAGTKGNWARFVNHSCDPNGETQKWNVQGQIRIGFFAKRPIRRGEEITIDYQFVQYGRQEQKCYCGSSNCNGVMGSTSKQLQEKVRMKDTRSVERRLGKLLSMECLRNIDDVHMLLKVLVQEYLMRDIRFDLLGIVLRTESEACLKMFRQYNGLELIASYMRDSDANDWTMKTRLLEVLDKIPVFEQKQLKSGTNLYGIVRQWSVDPRFCRQRNAPMTAQSSCGGSGSMGSGRGPDSVVPSPATTATTNEDGDTAESIAGGSVNGGPESNPVLAAVDLETGEKTGLDSEEDNQQWEQIRDAASRLLMKWQQLPDEIYRIPKVERHETEQSLQPSSQTSAAGDKISRHRSSVLSSSQSRAPLISWGLPVSDKKRPASPSSRASEGSVKPGTTSSNGGNIGAGTPRLPKDEFRRLFEAYVRFEEEQKKLSEEQKKLSEQRKQHEIDLSKIHDPSLQDAVEKIRQLLSRTLLHAIEQLKRGMQPQLVLPPDLTEVAQDEKVQRLLGELQHVEMSQLLTLLSGCDGPADGTSSTGERSNNLLPGQALPLSGPEEQLPPNWKWARDRDGRLYFYHVLTKKTQWEAPLYPWDAGEDDPEAYCYNNAHLYQISHDEIAAMHVRIQKILKEKAKREKNQRKRSIKKSKKDPNWEEKQKLRFHKQMYKIIASHLHKYRSSETKIGRITNSSDMKYLGKKLAQTILHKEIKRLRSVKDLEVNANVTTKAITYVDKYMTGRGIVYTRRSSSHRQRLSSASALSPGEHPDEMKKRLIGENVRTTIPLQQFTPSHAEDHHSHCDEQSLDSPNRDCLKDPEEYPCHDILLQGVADEDGPIIERTKSLSICQESFEDNDSCGDRGEFIHPVQCYSKDQVMADDELKELDNLL